MNPNFIISPKLDSKENVNSPSKALNFATLSLDQGANSREGPINNIEIPPLKIPKLVSLDLLMLNVSNANPKITDLRMPNLTGLAIMGNFSDPDHKKKLCSSPGKYDSQTKDNPLLAFQEIPLSKLAISPKSSQSDSFNKPGKIGGIPRLSFGTLSLTGHIRNIPSQPMEIGNIPSLSDLAIQNPMTTSLMFCQQQNANMSPNIPELSPVKSSNRYGEQQLSLTELALQHEESMRGKSAEAESNFASAIQELIKVNIQRSAMKPTPEYKNLTLCKSTSKPADLAGVKSNKQGSSVAAIGPMTIFGRVFTAGYMGSYSRKRKMQTGQNGTGKFIKRKAPAVRKVFLLSENMQKYQDHLFHFDSPSPDDIVLVKQAQVGGGIARDGLINKKEIFNDL